MSLEGTWIITQHWNGMDPYHFPANFGDGTIEVEGGYFGTWTVLGSSSQVALAIANFDRHTITSYNGNVVGPTMGGQMTGGSPGGRTVQGEWSAQREQHHGAPRKALTHPSES